MSVKKGILPATAMIKKTQIATPTATETATTVAPTTTSPSAQIPALSKFWVDAMPDANAAIKSMPGLIQQTGIGNVRTMGNSGWTGSPEDIAAGKGKYEMRGAGNEEVFMKGVTQIIDQLDKANVKPEQARTFLYENMKPGNRERFLKSDNLFRDPTYIMWSKQDIGSGKTRDEDFIDSIAAKYSQLKQTRDKQYGVGPAGVQQSTQPVSSVPVSTIAEKIISAKPGVKLKVTKGL